jgi:hypothetical protein
MDLYHAQGKRASSADQAKPWSFISQVGPGTRLPPIPFIGGWEVGNGRNTLVTIINRIAKPVPTTFLSPFGVCGGTKLRGLYHLMS